MQRRAGINLWPFRRERGQTWWMTADWSRRSRRSGDHVRGQFVPLDSVEHGSMTRQRDQCYLAMALIRTSRLRTAGDGARRNHEQECLNVGPSGCPTAVADHSGAIGVELTNPVCAPSRTPLRPCPLIEDQEVRWGSRYLGNVAPGTSGGSRLEPRCYQYTHVVDGGSLSSTLYILHAKQSPRWQRRIRWTDHERRSVS